MAVTDGTRGGQIITFYSYKGGTGRTMALANLAVILSRRASTKGAGPVLAIDWDLEAPGLHRYFASLADADADADADDDAGHDGLIELFETLRAGIDDRSSQDENDEHLAQRLVGEVDFERFVQQSAIPGLSFMTAGCIDDRYPARVTGFDWSDLHGRLPTLIAALSRRLTDEYAYVLIDSRTGINDTSGICTMMLPDALVSVFTPNLQSLRGLLTVVRKAADFRRGSGDPRPLTVFPLASRIEAARPSLLDDWRRGGLKVPTGYQPAFERLFEEVYGLERCNLEAYFDDVQIQHVPDYAYGEEIAVVVEETDSRLSLRRSYEQFAAWMLETGAPWLDPAAVASQRRVRELCARARTAIDTGELAEAETFLARVGEEPTAVDADVAPELAAVFGELGEALFGASRLADAEQAFRQAVGAASAEGGLDASRYTERLADVLAELGRSAEAVDHLRRVVNDREAALGAEHVAVADAYEKLGTALGRIGAFHEGLEMLGRGLDIRIAAVGASDPSVATSYERLAGATARSGAVREAERHFLHALEIIPEAATADRARLLNALASLYLRGGDGLGAQRCFEQAVALARVDDAQLAVSFDGLGHVALSRGDHGLARDHFEHAQALRERVLGPEHPELLISYLNLGELALAEGGLDRARRQFERAISHAQRSGEGVSLGAEALRRLALVEIRLGDVHAAEADLLRALALDMELGDRTATATTHRMLGDVASQRSEYDAAIQHYTEASVLQEQMGDRAGLAETVVRQAEMERRRGDGAAAERLARRALGLREELGNLAAIGMAHLQIADVGFQRISGAEVALHAREALAIFERLDDARGIAASLAALGNLALFERRHEEAEQHFRRALEIQQQLNDHAGVAWVHARLGTLAAAVGDLEEAGKRYRVALDLAERLGDQSSIAEYARGLARVARRRGDLGEAERSALWALQIDEHIGHRRHHAEDLIELAAIAWTHGAADEAVRRIAQIASPTGDEDEIAQMYVALKRLLPLRDRLDDSAFDELIATGLDAEAGETLRSLLEEISAAEDQPRPPEDLH
jgi:eukaryotic-like serine/threonine-protein kinase